MGKRNEGWRETFIALGESLIEVLRAELAVIGEAWQRSGRELAIALGIFAFAAYIALICLPVLLILALVAGLDIWLPLWGAALVTAALVAVIVYVLVMVASNRMLKRCENPVATVTDRFADHVVWWNERVLQSDATLDSSPSGGPGESDDATVAPEGQEPNVAGERSAGEPPPGS